MGGLRVVCGDKMTNGQKFWFGFIVAWVVFAVIVTGYYASK